MSIIVVLEDAIEDIARARDFYDRLQQGLGDICADALWADIERLTDLHGVHAKFFGFHRLLSARFPCGIYYRDSPIRTEVFAVPYLRRDPLWLRGQLTAHGP